MELIITDFSKVAALVGILAFIVSIIIEVIKNIGPMKKVPTQLVTIIISIVICTVGYIGFDTLKELYERFHK